jgi:hypothetical protein
LNVVVTIGVELAPGPQFPPESGLDVAPFPLCWHVVVDCCPPFLKAIALEVTKGAIANAAVTATMTVAITNVFVCIVKYYK